MLYQCCQLPRQSTGQLHHTEGGHYHTAQASGCRRTRTSSPRLSWRAYPPGRSRDPTPPNPAAAASAACAASAAAAAAAAAAFLGGSDGLQGM